ncbi:hypothetical protein MINTM005_13100 [Mycobacterium intracellulare]|uniref:macro domain-containing protein n=1 Tax=Mycobacterium intracellulare TaxID=1767 RepID=UPI001926F7DE|nr:macro domain-containing protein [Mycobacterium intracellulare]BCO56066.1 hypothetical protein MINTM005_13100 [Mycobacterium intracellulare]
MNILDSDCEAIINTVNCVGVMGKGLALQFKQRYPYMFLDYKDACAAGRVELGRIHVYEDHATGKLIINFPTKQHWRNDSRIEYIEWGLKNLRRYLKAGGIKSIAIPPLGCGLGGLDWDDVERLLREHLHDLPVRVMIYPPDGAPYQLKTLA